MDKLLDSKKHKAEKTAIQKLKQNLVDKEDRWITDPLRKEKKILRRRNKRSVNNKIRQAIKSGRIDSLDE